MDRLGGDTVARRKVVRKFGTVSTLTDHDALLRKGLEHYQNRASIIIEVDGTQETENSAREIADKLQKHIKQA